MSVLCYETAWREASVLVTDNFAHYLLHSFAQDSSENFVISVEECDGTVVSYVFSVVLFVEYADGTRF